jgi:hypothetical protein
MDYRKQHPWEEEGWNALEQVLDKEMPVASPWTENKYLSTLLLLFCFATVAGWGMLEYLAASQGSDGSELAELSAQTEHVPSSIEVETARNLPTRSNQGYDNLIYAHAGGDQNEVSRLPFSSALGGFGSPERAFLNSIPQTKLFSLRFRGIQSLLTPSTPFVSTRDDLDQVPLAMQVLTKPLSNPGTVFGSFVEVHIQNQSSNLWGGGAFVGISYNGSSPWETSLSVGYQYLKSQTLEADGGYSVPLVLPGSNPDDVSQPPENVFGSLDLPQVQVHAHRIGISGQFDWNIAGKFGLGAIARASLDWYTMNPDLSTNSMRYYYPDLGFSKRDEPNSYFHLGAGINASYKLGKSWSLQTRGMLTKSFTGLNTKPTYIDAYIWSFESGVRYQF